MKTILLLLLPFFALAQPVLKPHIGLNNPPQNADPICSIPVYQGSMNNSGYFEGDTVPDFTLYKRNGDSVRLHDLLLNNKPVLLVGANYTCPVWRGKISVLNQITNYYGSQLQVYAVYTVEAHPNAPDVSPYSGQVWVTSANQNEGVLYPQPTTYGERLTVVDSMLAHYSIVPDILIDGPCNEWWSHYGPAPNNAYLIAPSGIVAAKHGWFHRAPENMWCDIDSLLGTSSGNCTYAGNNGSFNVTLDDGDSIIYGFAGEVLSVHTTIHNLSATENVTLNIQKQSINIPADWATALCADICYATTVNSIDITIPPGETQPFIFYFYSGATPDTGRARIRFTNLNNSNNVIVRRFMGITQEAPSAVIASSELEKALKVYPQPVNDLMTVEVGNELVGEKISVFDFTGRQIFETTLTRSKLQIETAHWQAGVYVVQTGSFNSKCFKQ